MISQSQFSPPLTSSFLCSMKLIPVLSVLGITHSEEWRRWHMPVDDTPDECVVSELDWVMPPLLKVVEDNEPFHPSLLLNFDLANGPDFTNPTTVPRDHENCVACLYRFLSLVLWTFLHHSKLDQHLQEPYKVTCFTHTLISVGNQILSCFIAFTANAQSPSGLI